MVQFLYDNKHERLVDLYEPGNNPSAKAYFATVLGRLDPSCTSPCKLGNSGRLLRAVDRLVTKLLFVRRPPDIKERATYATLQNDRKVAIATAFQELMIWAVLMNHYRLAEYFWQEGGHSIPNALLASRLYTGMAQTDVLNRHGHFRDTVVKMERMSKKFETLARGVLDECHKDNSDRAGEILRVKLDSFRLVSITACSRVNVISCCP